jgi:uncharacterized protein YunC (DUF1805 family)
MTKARIKSGGKNIYGYVIALGAKKLVLLVGSKGYVMCGYLNLSAARKLGDAAIKITGVSSIKEALKAKVHSLSPAAKKLGIHKGEPIKEVLSKIA